MGKERQKRQNYRIEPFSDAYPDAKAILVGAHGITLEEFFIMKIRLLVILLILFGIIGCSSEGDIGIVKNGHLDFAQSVTVGQAFGAYRYFKSKSWRKFKTEEGKRNVEFVGEFDCNNMEIKKKVKGSNKLVEQRLLVLFTINPDNSIKISGVNFHRKFSNGQENDFSFSEISSIFINSLYQNEPPVL